jgi:hypothetical protein
MANSGGIPPTDAKFLDGLRGGKSIPGIEKEPREKSTTNINPSPYCKLSNSLEEFGYK